jgi:hypothetical protein
MQVMLAREQGRRLKEAVQIDDALPGGESTGGKRGWASENKVPLIATVQTAVCGQPLVTRLDVLPG